MDINRFAPLYRWTEYAAFGRALERRRFAFLPQLSKARRILILGEGDGRALQRLLVLAPLAEIDVVEYSAAMISLARRRVGDCSRVRFQQHDILAASLSLNTYDGLITFFFLDCFHEADAREVVRRLEATLVPGALWLVSDFAIPPQGWRKWHAILWIWAIYRFFSISTGLRTRKLPPIEKLLTEAGMRRVQSEQERGGMIRSEVWEKRKI